MGRRKRFGDGRLRDGRISSRDGDPERMTDMTGPWPVSAALRPWQAEALATYQASEMENFLCASTPGAGKTTFGLRVAHELLNRGEVERVAVVVPTRHLCRQWAREAALVGI